MCNLVHVWVPRHTHSAGVLGGCLCVPSSTALHNTCSHDKRPVDFNGAQCSAAKAAPPGTHAACASV